MKLTILSVGAALALASAPAYAQLASSGNLVTTTGQQPNWPGAAHQSTTLVGAGGGSRGVIVSANGGDLAPGVNAGKTVILPAAARSNTPDRSAGVLVEAGGQKGGVTNGALARVQLSNSLGEGPSNTYREVGVNLPKQ